MCDNAAKTIGSNHLKHIAWSFSVTKKLWELACSHRLQLFFGRDALL